MNPRSLRALLERVRDGRTSVPDALKEVRSLPFKDLGFAKVDSHRHLRCGFPEVIFCQGKTTEQVVRIAEHILAGEHDLLATRAERDVYDAIAQRHPKAEYNDRAKTIVVRRTKRKLSKGLILVVSAGTADIPVAEEARVTAEIMGNRVQTLYDVGVAGIHRLLSKHQELSEANVIIVVAGMEGALASVIGGLVDRPVIGVPTSIGYGASFGGIAPLLTMLNSCAAGVAVVNINNGFGAGYVASLINQGRRRVNEASKT